MGIFKKTIKYSKPSVEIDSKIQELDEGLKKTRSSLPDQSLSTEDIDQILSEEITDIQNWREIFDEETVSEYENQIQEIRERHNDLIKVQGSIEHVKTKEVHQIFNELYQGEVEKVVDNYVSKYSSDIIDLREDLFHEIKKRPTVDLKILEDKINLLTVKYNQLSEGLLDDPVTDLNDSISFKQLKDHYQLLVGKLQEQLATLGGGGEVRLQYLDDIVGIATNPSAYDGKYLRYNDSLKKFEFVTVSGGGGGSYGNSDVDSHLNVSGASSGQILSWNGTDYDWVADQTGSVGSGISLTDLSVVTEPSGTATLVYNNSNGVFNYTPPDLSGYATQSYVDTEVAGVITFSGDYNALTNKPTIPTDVGDLTNNVGFVTIGEVGGSISTANVKTNSLVVSGFSTFLSDATFAGITTITSDSFFTKQISVSGVSTFYDQTTINEVDFTISGDQTTNIIGIDNNKDLKLRNSDSSQRLILSGDGSVEICNSNDEQPSVRIINESVQLLHGDPSSKKLETTGYGVTIFGTAQTQQLNVSGVATATSFSGNGNDIVHSTWTLGANGSNHYTFTGPGGLSATDDPKIYLARGQTYEFVNNSGGSHPFQIRQSNGGSAYNTGVTNNGSSSGTIRFEVPFSAPNTLYYQCTNHVGMGNTIIVYPDLST